MHAWDVASSEALTLASLNAVLDAADRIDVLLIGLGNNISRIDPAIRAALRDRRVIVEAIGTGGAVRTYNVLLAEERQVAAALIAVENVR